MKLLSTFSHPSIHLTGIKRKLKLAATLCCTMALLGASAVADTSVTKIYSHGDIVTLNDKQPTAQALATRDGIIIAVGSLEEVSNTAGENAVAIDLDGATLLPGFIDAHGHFSGASLMQSMVNASSPPVGQITDIASLQSSLTKVKASTQPGDWIMGYGYDDSLLTENRHPTRRDLDQVSTDHPIMLLHVSGHLATCNSRCLELMKLNKDSKAPAGGVYQRFENGELNGVLEEHAIYPLFALLPIYDPKTRMASVPKTIGAFASYGVTTLQDSAVSEQDMKLTQSAVEQGLVKTDLISYIHYRYMNLLKTEFQPSLEYNNHWRVGGVKLILDGSPQGKTAHLSKPYFVPPPTQKSDYRGYPSMTDEALQQDVEKAFSNNWQIHAHVNGDAATDQFLNAIELAADKYGNENRRTTMIHAQILRKEQLSKMKALDIIPSFFVSHTFFWGDWHRDSVLGPERAAFISPVASAIKQDMLFTLHNDTPITPPDMLRLVWTAVNRVTRSGKVLGANERISVESALKGVTINAAYQNFEEDIKGTLSVGKKADMVILAENPIKVMPIEIKNIAIIKTIANGEVIYTNNAKGK